MAQKTEESKSFFESLEIFFGKRKGFIFILSLVLVTVLSLLSFNVNVSIGGDDSFYILRAFRFVKDWTFPSFQGPLYPIVLSPIIWLFGLNVALIKLFSVLFTTVFVFFFYKSFKDRISNLVLIMTVLFLAVNYQVLYYASQTYSEAFHAMLQAGFLFWFFRFYDQLKERDAIIQKDWKNFLLLGSMLLLIVLSKNVGITLVLSIGLFFLLEKKWMAMLFSGFSFAGVYGVYHLLKKLFIEEEFQMKAQGSVLLLKDPYDPSKGNEDFMGFVDRLIGNSTNYLSKNMMKILHLRADSVTNSIDLLTIIITALIIVGLIMWYKKNKIIFFTGLYTTLTLFVIFIIVQTRWDSDRLIFIVAPLFLLFILSTLRGLFMKLKAKFLQPLFLVFTVIFLFVNFTQSTSKIDILKIRKNLAGEKYLGYTTDWQNYLKMSEWSAKNLPQESYVACRKAGMSSIYANGKEFFNITRVFSDNADTLLDRLQENGVTHVIMARLRRNPKMKSQYTINTVQRYLATIDQKYPGSFYPVHQEGTKGNEEANLFLIRYEVRRQANPGYPEPKVVKP